MESIDLLRFFSLCILLACAETLHGIARTVLLAPGVGAAGIGEHLLLGLGLSGFMAAFDVALGRLIMHLKWSRIWEDFDPRSGNYLSFGLVFLALSPSVVWWLRGGTLV